jgi:adenine-specific DNA-methyltransferase
LYKPKGELTKIEALGLSTLLNSSIFEIYFRTFNGNTNVSASELRIMTFPPYDQILNIGKLVSDLKEINMTEIDKIIEDVLGIKFAY